VDPKGFDIDGFFPVGDDMPAYSATCNGDTLTPITCRGIAVRGQSHFSGLVAIEVESMENA